MLFIRIVMDYEAMPATVVTAVTLNVKMAVCAVLFVSEREL